MDVNHILRSTAVRKFGGFVEGSFHDSAFSMRLSGQGCTPGESGRRDEMRMPVNPGHRHQAALGIGGATVFSPRSFNVMATAETTLRISLASIAPMQPTRKVSTCVSLPGYRM